MDYSQFLGQDTTQPVLPQVGDIIDIETVAGSLPVSTLQTVNVSFKKQLDISGDLTPDVILEKGISLGMVPKTELDTFWYEKDVVSGTRITDLYSLIVEPHNKGAYWETLKREADPADYLALLALRGAAGVVLREYAECSTVPGTLHYSGTYQEGGVAVIPTDGRIQNFRSYAWATDTRLGGGSIRTPIQASIRADRERYVECCKKFGEPLLLSILPQVHTVLDVAHYRDLATLRAAHNALINRMDIPSKIKGTHSILLYDPIRGKLARKVSVHIPNDFVFGPRIIYHDGSVRTAQDALFFEWAQVANLLFANILKLEGRIAQMADPSTTVIRTAWEQDPLSDPFLILNIEKSIEAKYPVYEDVAVNLTKSSGERYTVRYGEEEGAPSLEHIMLAPLIREDALRKIRLDYGGSVSINDLKNKGLIDDNGKKSLMPFLLGGIAAGFIATQAL